MYRAIQSVADAPPKTWVTIVPPGATEAGQPNKGSSLVMVPKPWASPMTAGPVGEDRFTKNVSFASGGVSPLIVPEIVCGAWPAVRVKVPVADT